MTLSPSDFSIETLTLPHEDPLEHQRHMNEWTTAHSTRSPIEQGLIQQAVVALLEKRRIERVRATLRTRRVRTAVVSFDRDEEDYVAQCLQIFYTSCEHAMRCLTRRASGCRWAIAQWERIQNMLLKYKTLHGEYRINMIQLLGHNACLDKLFVSEPAFRTWLDCIVANPNPKQKDIDQILDPMCVPATLQERDEVLWPGDPAASRARLQGIVDGELARLKALEETLRVEYELPARAEAQDMALASVTEEEMPLLRAERMYEQAYGRAVTALLKARKQAAAAPRPTPVATARELDAKLLELGPIVKAPAPAVSEASGRGSGTHGHGGLVLDPFHLPVIELDGRASAEELDDGDEVIALAAADDGAHHPHERAGLDPDPGPDGHDWLGEDGESRGEHLVDLAQVVDQGVLLEDFQDIRQAIGPQRLKPGEVIATKEKVAGEQRNNRPDLPPLRRAVDLDDLG